jgi:hypothetical protein
MLGFKGKDLIVGLLRNSLSLICGSVEVLCLFIGNLDIFAIDIVDSDLISHFLSHNINLVSEVLVLRLEVVVLNQMLI